MIQGVLPVNLTQLKYFRAICTYRSVSGAAEHLHISQPSLSCAVKELEREFGIVLFRRHYRGMTLTPEGEKLLKMAEQILRDMDRAEEMMQSMGKGRKRLRLGVPPMIGSLILPKIYGSFISETENISLEITEGGRLALLEKLRNDTLDMVFLPHSGLLEQDYAAVGLTKLPIVCCTTTGNPLSGLSSVTPSDVSQTPVVLFEDSFFQTEKIKKWFSDGGVRPKIILQTEQLSTMQSIISNDIAAGFMFRQLVEADPKLVPIPVENTLEVDISLVWRKHGHISDSMKMFIDFVKKKNLFDYQK